LTAHPDGCEQNIKNQIEYVKSKGANGAKSISNWCFDRIWISFKISSAFGSDAATIGVFLKTTTRKNSFPGWYNSAAFEEAQKQVYMLKCQRRCLF
jgi:enoyl-[acyl-carrier protein] reductase/trans-2-enoyl-CoA reductase (NAD+)